MQLTPPPPHRQSSAHNDHRDQQSSMDGTFRTPSPAPEAYLSSAEATPRTPVQIRPGLFSTVGEAVFEDHGALSELATPPAASMPHPQTPTFKRIKTRWHGLPSPQTPSSMIEISTQQFVDSRSDNDRDSRQELGDSFWTSESAECDVNALASPITLGSASSTDVSQVIPQDPVTPTSIEADADLAFQLSSPSSIRRSTRLRNKTKTQEDSKPTTKLVKTATEVPSRVPQESVKQVLTLSEPTTSPFEVTIASTDQLPALHSAQWQLQYPPGGSTHPSYPWPSADPRLVFHAHFVPLNNGLPSAPHMTTLSLPIGWTHASWSGLHPVVFDPYQQLFKLTPVGPLPLTSEEVHQGGLQDYAPGGKLHPEFGLLPLLSSVSDGSDSEVFNFEGVDWKLPWAQVEGGFELESTLANVPLSADFVLPAAADTNVAPVVQMKPHYIEARDCPDNVMDLEDAWRWLKEWDINSTAAFEATPGKTWRGAGIPLTTRKTKQPIASLMALTMTDKDPNVEHYLVKQVRREFCPFKSVATPVHIDITLLQDIEFTIIELLSYFPSHYQWRGGANRLARSGMGPSDIANLVNMVRRLPVGSTCHASTVDGYVWWERQEDGTRVRVEPSENDGTCYTAEHWSNIIWEKTDYPLLALAHGLLELPSGPDAGPLTALIKWCRDNNRHTTMLSDVPALLKEANIEPLIDPGNGVDPDKEVLGRHAEAMRIDRKRVIQEKKNLDAGKEKKSRKRRLE